MSEGFSGAFTQPYKGGQRQGAVGVLKGLAKGTLGMTTNVSSGTLCTSLIGCNCHPEKETDWATAALGLVAYPADGMIKSLYTATHANTRKQIIRARLKEGRYLAEHLPKARANCQSILRAFEIRARKPTES